MGPQQGQDRRRMITRRTGRNLSMSVESLETRNLLSMGSAMPAMAPMMNPTTAVMSSMPVMTNPMPAMTNPMPVMTNPTPVMANPTPVSMNSPTNVSAPSTSGMTRTNPVISGVAGENLATIAMESSFPTFGPTAVVNNPMRLVTGNSNPPVVPTNATIVSVAKSLSPAPAPEAAKAPVAIDHHAVVHHAVVHHQPVVVHREHHAPVKRR
jgi:hypothetical protein